MRIYAPVLAFHIAYIRIASSPFFQVLEHLHPLDLYNLCSASPAIKGFIEAHSCLWKTTWERSDMMRCPPEWTYATGQWSPSDRLYAP